MAARPPTREELIQQDIQELHRLGYAQQLFREMGGFSNFAISFSIISILTGAILLYGYGLKFAGPIINSVGWPVVSLFTPGWWRSIGRRRSRWSSCSRCCRRSGPIPVTTPRPTSPERR
jgi:hypothetical protein